MISTQSVPLALACLLAANAVSSPGMSQDGDHRSAAVTLGPWDSGASMPRPTERYILWTFDEATLGQDCNGDSDAIDSIFTIYDAKRGLTQATGLAAKALPNFSAIGALSNENVLLLVSEQDQGASDLNGDGDCDDFVLHWIDGRSGVIRNIGIACKSTPMLAEGLALIPADEVADGRDWSGDGVIAGEAWVIADIINQTLSPLGLVHLSGNTSLSVSRATVTNNAFRFPISEAGNALDKIDYTGNGNTSDVVSAFLDPRTKTLRFTPFPVRGYVRDILGHELEFVDEGVWMRDINGDGQIVAGDFFLVDHDPVTGMILHAPTRVDFLGGFSSPTLGQGLVINGDERLNGDQNGDGDSADTFLWIHDVSTGSGNLLSLTSLDLAGSDDPGSFFLVAPESDLGSDSNGDGDLDDSVPMLVDIRTAGTTVLPIAAVKVRESHDDLFVLVDEADQAKTDWNGDGDALDFVWARFDPARLEARSLGVAADSGLIPMVPTEHLSGLLILSQESAQATDWNNDGDLDDNVIILHSRTGDRIRSTGESVLVDVARFSGLAGIQLDAPALPFFIESELNQGRDLNGDGVIAGSFLRLLRFR